MNFSRAFALSLWFFVPLLAGCGNEDRSSPHQTPEKVIDAMQSAFESGDAEMIDELVDFDVIRAEIRRSYVEAFRAEPGFQQHLREEGISNEDLEAKIDQLVSEVNAATVAALVSQPHDPTVPSHFPEMWEGWSIRPIDESTFVAQHPDRSFPGGTIGLVFELQGNRYRVTDIEACGMNLRELAALASKSPDFPCN